MHFVHFVRGFRLVPYMHVFQSATGKHVHEVHRVHFLLRGRTPTRTRAQGLRREMLHKVHKVH